VVHLWSTVLGVPLGRRGGGGRGAARKETVMTSATTRAELTEKLLGIKRENGWTWKHICAEIGGMSPVLVTGAILGQMKLTKPQAAKAAELFGLSKTEQALLHEVPHPGSTMPPPHPRIYRFDKIAVEQV